MLFKHYMLIVACAAAAMTGCDSQKREAEIHILHLGNQLIRVELAEDPEQWEAGLMNRKHLPVLDGMLFRFFESKQHCMWMKNTPIPLAVIFVDATGKVINVESMKPQTLDKHCSSAASLYAIEINPALLKIAPIQAGDKIKGLPQSHPFPNS